MFQLPKGLYALKYPGYFYCPKEQQVYSIKSGTLKPLKKCRWYFPQVPQTRGKKVPYFQLSVKGKTVPALVLILDNDVKRGNLKKKGIIGETIWRNT